VKPVVVVIGGGITGHLVKLRIPSATVLDAREGATPMTRQYGGNYLWQALQDVPCRSFTVHTTVDGCAPEPGRVQSYKTKIGKGMDDNWRDQFRPVVTGFEIVEWPRPLEIFYGCSVRYIDTEAKKVHLISNGAMESAGYDILISTIPLPAMLEMVGERFIPFQSAPIHVTTMQIPPDAPRRNGDWFVNYISDPSVPAYRTTDRDGTRHYESLAATGIPTKKIHPGKIWPHGRRDYYLDRLRAMDIHCFGRFARWAPEELVHETDEDIIRWANAMDLSS